MAVLFFAAATIQYNDPDPIGWTLIYGLAGLVALVHDRLPRGRKAAPLLLCAVALVWAAWIAFHINGDVTAPELFRRMDPNRPQIEEARELIGLLIVACWTATLAVRGFRSSGR